MQRHVNDQLGVIKAALPFLQNSQANRCVHSKDLAEIIEESKEIIALHDSMPEQDPPTFESELKSLINRFSKEGGSDTPDFILCEFLINALNIFDIATNERRNWHTIQTVDKLRQGCPKPDALKSKEERKAEALREINKTPYGASLGKNAPEIVPGLKFANVHMPGHSFEVKTVDTEENTLNVYITKGDGLPWPDTWNLEHTRWGFERGNTGN